jgi:hypothetical protein
MGGALLTFAQAPATSGTWQGHLLCLGQTLPSICPAVRTCSAWALPLGVAHQDFSLTGDTPSSVNLRHVGPQQPKLCKEEVSRCGRVCAYMCWYACGRMCVCVCVCCNFPVSITSSLGLGSSWLSLWSYEGEGGHSTLLLLPPAVPSFGAVMYIRGREGQGVVPLLGECGTRGWA